MFSLLLALSAPTASAQDVPAGAQIERAVSVQITRDGLDSFGQIVPGLVPGSFPVDDVDTSGGALGCVGSWDIQIGNTAAGMGIEIGVVSEDVRISPRTGILDVEIDLLVNLNDSGNPFDFDFEVPICITGNCAGWVRPFPVTARVPFQLAVATGPDGNRFIDATVGTLEIENGLDNEDIELTESCGTLDAIDEALGSVGFSIFDFIISSVDPFLADIVQGQVGDIELLIEDALAQARYDDVVELAGAELDILVEPRDIDITPNGLAIDLLGAIAADPAECIADRDPGGSLLTDTLVPAIEDNPAGTEFIIHAGDELINQGLYGVWRSGVLCYEISADSDVDIGFPIDSSLLSIVGGDGFDALIPETKPLVILTDPREVPTANFEAGYDLTAEVRELGVDFYSEVDFRQTRALGLTVEADAGIDLIFDGNTGVLAADVALGPDNITIIASHNLLVAEASADIEQSVAGLLDVLLDSLVGDALSGLEFGLPSFEGIGLASTTVAPTGDGDWLGIDATVGPVAYEGGCDSEGGCSGGDTGGGCSNAAGSLGAALFLVPLLLVRRRRV